jgi:hypothetical protein
VPDGDSYSERNITIPVERAKNSHSITVKTFTKRNDVSESTPTAEDLLLFHIAEPTVAQLRRPGTIFHHLRLVSFWLWPSGVTEPFDRSWMPFDAESHECSCAFACVAEKSVSLTPLATMYSLGKG